MINLGAIRAKYEQLKRGDTNRFKPATGVNYIRIVSFTHGKVEFVYLSSKQHFGVRRTGSKAPIECPSALYGGDCGVDEFMELITNDPDDFNPEDLELVKHWQTKDVVYFNVVDIRHLELACQIWPCSAKLGQEVLGLITAMDENNRLLYPDMCSRDRGINLKLTNSGTGFDRYQLEIQMVQEGDVLRISRSALPPEIKPVDLFAYVKAPCYEWTVAAINETSRDGMPEAHMRSKLEVLGEPSKEKPGWLEYLQEETSGNLPFVPDKPIIPQETIIVPAEKVTVNKPVSILDKLRGKKAAQVEAPVIPPTSEGKPREALLDEQGDIPWCCGYVDTDTGELHNGEWVGEADPACVQCLAASVCKENTHIETGLEQLSESPAEPAQEKLPGFPEDEAAKARAATKTSAAKKTTAKNSANGKGSTADILARLKAKKQGK